PDLWTPLLGQPHPLKVERSHAKTEAVGKHHGQWRVGGPDFTHRKVYSVRSGHQITAVTVERLEILVGERVVDHRTPVQHRMRHCGAGDGADCADSGGTGQPTSPPRLAEMQAVKMVVVQSFSASR